MHRKFYGVAAAVIMGAALGGLLANAQAGRFNVQSTIGGTTDGVLIALALGVYHWFIYRGFARNFFRQKTFAVVIILQFSVYLVLIVVMRTLGRFIAGGYSNISDIATDPHTAESTIVAAGAALLLNFLVYIIGLLDVRSVLAFLSGRYHRPREENRIFLFVDLVSSTTIAEKVGGLKFALLLDRFFSDMTDPLLTTGGAIYKYVGDEAIITWSSHTKGASKNCIRFVSLLAADIEKRRAGYEKDFGMVPAFRAGAHAGEVTACEIGTIKKEIAFLGDTVNVTARLLEAARKMGRPFVISKAVASGLSDAERSLFEKMGSVEVRGRSELVEVYAVR